MSAIKCLVRLSPVCHGVTCNGCGQHFTDYFDFTSHICPQNIR